MSDVLKEDGLRLFRQGEHDQALAKFEAAAAAYQAAGDHANAAEMRNNQGVIYRYRADWAAAQTALTEAAAIFAELGDVNRQGQALGNLAEVQALSGDRAAAANAYQAAAAALGEAGDGEKQGLVLYRLSLLRLRQRRWLEAITLMDQSFTVRPRLTIGQRLLAAIMRLGRRAFTGQ